MADYRMLKSRLNHKFQHIDLILEDCDFKG